MMKLSIKALRARSGMTQIKFAAYFNMPYKTLQGWENQGKSPAPYVLEMMEKILVLEGIIENSQISKESIDKNNSDGVQ